MENFSDIIKLFFDDLEIQTCINVKINGKTYKLIDKRIFNDPRTGNKYIFFRPDDDSKFIKINLDKFIDFIISNFDSKNNLELLKSLIKNISSPPSTKNDHDGKIVRKNLHAELKNRGIIFEDLNQSVKNILDSESDPTTKIEMLLNDEDGQKFIIRVSGENDNIIDKLRSMLKTSFGRSVIIKKMEKFML